MMLGIIIIVSGFGEQLNNIKCCASSVVVGSVAFSDFEMLYEQVRPYRLSLAVSHFSNPRSMLHRQASSSQFRFEIFLIMNSSIASRDAPNIHSSGIVDINISADFLMLGRRLRAINE